MPRYRLTLEYDGGPFVGLQRQSQGQSVQQAVEDAAFRLTGEQVRMHAAGRTDSGVHALGMVAHIDVAKPFQPFRLMEALNHYLKPDPVVVLACEVKPDDWHARFSCLGRAYEYRITNRRSPLTLDKGRAWHIARPLDVEAMHRAAQTLVGHHDFTTFRSVHCQSQSPEKTLDLLTVARQGEHVVLHAAARSFLHHQVRSMVGTLALVGQGLWAEGDVKTSLDARDRAALGLNAPPDGLYFVQATYSA